MGDLSNAELRTLTDQLERIRFGDDEVTVRRLLVQGLLPETDHYMTYEGSTTAPGCHETVTWIVLNKPIYITKQQVSGNEVTVEKWETPHSKRICCCNGIMGMEPNIGCRL